MSSSRIYFESQVADGLDLAHEHMDGYLGLRGVTSAGRIDLHGASAKGNASLKYADLPGLYASGFDVGGVLHLGWAAMDDAFLCEGSAGELRGRGVTVDGTLDLRGFETGTYDLRDAELGTLDVAWTDATIDLRGAAVDTLYADDLDAYDIRVDADTWIGEVYEDALPLRGGPDLTGPEQDLLDRIHDRPLFPLQRRDGCTFTYDALKQDFVMSHHHPVFMNLVKKGAVERLDEEWYVARTDPL